MYFPKRNRIFLPSFDENNLLIFRGENSFFRTLFSKRKDATPFADRQVSKYKIIAFEYREKMLFYQHFVLFKKELMFRVKRVDVYTKKSWF